MELKDYILASAKDSNLLDQLQNQKISEEQLQAIKDADSLHDKITEALKTVHDPEIPVNIFDLGLVYKIDISDENDVEIDMTLTAPGCPVAGAMPIEVEKRIKALVKDAGEVKVNLVWTPKWSKEMMSDEAKLALDMW